MIKKLSASLLQSSVSHDPSEIILICSFAVKETLLLLLLLLLLSIFKTVEYIRILWLNIERSKVQHLSEIKRFCNIIHYTKILGIEIITFWFSKDWSKVMIKTFIMLQKISISDKCCSSELSIHQRNLKKIFSAFNIIIINVFWAANQHIRMISEGSCDWSDAEKIQLFDHRNQ